MSTLSQIRSVILSCSIIIICCGLANAQSEGPWDAVDRFLAALQHHTIELEAKSKPGTKPVPLRKIRLDLGEDLWGSRSYVITENLDSEGKVRRYFDEKLFRKDELLSVNYFLTEGETLKTPEKNVNLTVRRGDRNNLTRFGIFPELFFGYLDTTQELLNLRSERVRSLFKERLEGNETALEYTSPDCTVELVFCSDDDKLRISELVVVGNNSPDERYQSERFRISDIEYSEGVVSSFDYDTHCIWKPEKAVEVSAHVPGGIEETHQTIEVRQISPWNSDFEVPRFKAIPVPNGFPARVLDSPGITYEYRDGEVVLQINPIAQKLIEQVFEISQSNTLDGIDWRAALLKACEDQPVQVKRDTSSYCGLYCTAAAAAMNGKKIPLESILSNKYTKSQFGSTAEEIRMAAQDFDLHSKVVYNANKTYLFESETPHVLHLGKNFSAGGRQHWVLFMGLDDDGDAVILDVPKPVEKIPITLLQTHWDGTAIAISSKPISSKPSRIALLYGAIPLGWSLLALMAIRFFFTAFKVKSFVTRLTIILALTAAFTGFWLGLSSNSFFRNSLAVALTQTKVGHDRVLPETFEVESMFGDEVLVVDARDPFDYSRGNVPGSINLPVNPSLGRLIEAKQIAASKKTVVVYCQSEQCKWSHAVGSKLKTLGIEDVKVFKPGWRGIVKERRAASNGK